MATLGSAIGLGILWKFPYTVGENGGGLFLLIYFACLLIVGIPLFIGELVIGRASSRAAVLAYDSLDRRRVGARSIGWFGALASFLIMSFYSVIAGWGMSYIMMSVTGLYSKGEGAIRGAFTALSTSGGTSLIWHGLFTLITMGVVLGGVRKGIEFWTKHMTRLLLIMLLFFFLYGITLPGFNEACRFIFLPNASGVTLSGALEALGLAFWTLSIGQGIMISYGSYMKTGDNIPRLAAIIGSAVALVSVLAALTIFPVVFTFGVEPAAGYGLVFETLPLLFAKLPGGSLLSALFFTLFVFTALTSAIPLIEVVATNIMEVWNVSRRKAVICVGCATFLCGIPSAYARTGVVFPEWQAIYGSTFLETVNLLVSNWIIPVGGLLSALFIGWRLDATLCERELGSRRFFAVWRVCIRYFVPITIGVILAQKSGVFG
jgi:NSS family neurotransmitter:Na+ symporter